MFERLTDRFIKTMAFARQSAEEHRHDLITPIHITIGLLGVSDSVAVGLLKELGVDTDKLSSSAVAIVEMTPLGQLTIGRLPQGPGAKRVIEFAIAEARELGHLHVGTEHVLLGLLRADNPTLRPLWQEAHIDLPQTRWELLKFLLNVSHAALKTSPPNSTRAPEPVGAYPSCRRVGNLLFISGQGPRQRGDKNIPGVRLDAAGKMIDYDIEAQVRAVMQNLRYILEENGSSWERIVDMTCFLTDLPRDFAEYNRVYAEYFPAGPNQPCRTTVGISSLPQGASAPIAFEVKAIATIG